MKRPAAVNLLLALNLLAIVCLGGVAGYFLFLTRAPAIRNDPEGGEAVHGLYLAAAILGPAAIFWIIALLGTLRRWAWGLWYGILLHLVTGGLFLYTCFDDWPDTDAGEISFAVVPVVIAFVYLTRPVRRYFAESRLAAASAGEGI